MGNSPSFPPRKLARYTSLSSVIDLIINRSIVFTDPNKWDDRNDAENITQYEMTLESQKILSVCFTTANQTYHHWKVFAPGTEGMRIEFHPKKLIGAATDDQRIKFGDVRYVPIRKIESHLASIFPREIPFIKRDVYKDELEYRFIFHSNRTNINHHRMNIELSWIKSITINPWIDRQRSDSIKKLLLQIAEGENIIIHRSTICENISWQSAVKK